MKNIPELKVKSKKQNYKDFSINYRKVEHASLPHIVKFSGGRSSGMMLFKLLEAGLLKPERGDVVIFNNTSAEHPKTYEFVCKCKDVCERVFGVPFFIVEHCTYEDAYQGEYIRMPTFRLANAKPHSKKNPVGYRWRGEVYEELLSWNGVVPSVFQRTCTIALKLQTTKYFLMDWFLNKPEIKRRGHFSPSKRIDLNSLYRRHIKNGGSVPKDVFLKKKRFVLEQPHFKDTQCWADYSNAYTDYENEWIQNKFFGDHVTFGKDAVEYVGLVGLRSDEKFRVQKILLKSDSSQVENDYVGEQIYAPLFEAGLMSKDVIRFWKSQHWDLELDPVAPLSNCTFCFLKGVKNLRLINSHFKELQDQSLVGTPCDINWWRRIEKQYSKDFVAEGKETRTTITDNLIGFFGARSGYLYKYIASEMQEADMETNYPAGFIPCECTE